MERTRYHKLIDILTIAVLGVLCGAEGFKDFERFGKAKESWLRQFLELPNGIPSHDTFGRVFARLDPDELNATFAQWMKTVMTALNGENPLAGEHVAVDGKRLRRSFTGGKYSTAAHIVNAWARHRRLVLALLKVDDDSNEITAIPELLKLLDLKGCIVSINTMGTQKEIAAQIVKAEGDYLLAIKGNHPHFYGQLHSLFDNFEDVGMDHDYAESEDTGHDRDERRRVWCISLDEAKTVWSAAEKAEAAKWSGLSSAVCGE
jgi:predicted transposase YbfD/YdcC